MGKFKLKDQLAGIAALIAAIVAIGGGFVKYGEIITVGWSKVGHLPVTTSVLRSILLNIIGCSMD